MKKALGINAIFSGLSGVSLMLFDERMAELFETTALTPFWLIGILLLIFSSTIIWEMKRRNPIVILWIITQDMLWVIGSAVILIWKPFIISNEGYGIIAVTAVIVFIMAVNQHIALSKVDDLPGSPRKLLEFIRIIPAAKSKTWQVISDVANYHQVASNIDSVTILSGEGKGMIRQCTHGSDSWKETCTLWQDEQVFSFVVDTSAANFPYPFSYMKGTWEVIEKETSQTMIKMTFEISYNLKIFNTILHPFMRRKFNTVCEDLLRNWEAIILHQ